MEVGWHLRFAREDALEFLVRSALAPNVEDAVFIAGGWLLEWDAWSRDDGCRDDESRDDGLALARVTRRPRSAP